MADHLTNLGTLGFTYRTRRLADRLAEGGRRLYESLEVPLEPNWHALLLYLDDHASVSVTEAAAMLGVSHPAVSEMTRRMEAAGLIRISSDPLDGRRRVLTLSAPGERRLPEFKALWRVIGEELGSIIETTAGSDAMGALSTFETELDGEELDARVWRRLERDGGPASRHHAARPALIRPTTGADRAAIVHIARELVRTPDTYAYDPDITDDALFSYWYPGDPGAGHSAELEGAIVGMFVIRPNVPGPGAHVANASFAVRADVRGMGLGRQMGEAALVIAADAGYRGMQFNTVVSTNTNAIRLWRSLGFRIVGTVPDGFRLPDGRLVPHYVMYRALP